MDCEYNHLHCCLFHNQSLRLEVKGNILEKWIHEHVRLLERAPTYVCCNQLKSVSSGRLAETLRQTPAAKVLSQKTCADLMN